MAEYIERESAINFAKHAYNEWNLAMAAADGKREINLVYKRQELCKAVESVFSDMKSEDVAPVVHAAWKECQKSMWYCCTNCGNETADDRSTGTEFLSDYCPNCGAKMDLEG